MFDSDEESSAKDFDVSDNDEKMSLKSDEDGSVVSLSLLNKPVTSRQKRNAKRVSENKELLEESRKAVEQMKIQEI